MCITCSLCSVYGAYLSTSSYTVTSTDSDTAKVLEPDDPVYDDVDEDEFRYYSLAVPVGSTTVSIELTALSGDPGACRLARHFLTLHSYTAFTHTGSDLAVSNTNRFPNVFVPDTYCAKSSTMRREVITLTAANADCWCTELPCT